jgi:hypothetical protein
MSSLFSCSVDPDTVWFRILGWGLVLNGSRPLFAERNGYRRVLRIPGTRWRLSVLKPL